MKIPLAQRTSPLVSAQASLDSPALRGRFPSLDIHLRRPHWLAGLAVALLVFASLTAHTQTYLIDFGGANTTSRGPLPNDPDNYWNNIGASIGGTDTGVLTNLVSSMNIPSGINLAMVNRFNGVNENGTQNTFTHPINATRDSMFGNTEVFSGLENIFPRFKLTGLDANTTYSFTFYASRTGVGDNRETEYTVTGGNSGVGALDAANNIDETVTVADITPDGSGEITISIGPGANNNNGNHFTYLGFLKVDAVPPQTPIGFTLQPVSQQVIQLKPATFTAAVTGAPPYSVQWYQNGQPLPGANQFSLTLPSVTLDMSGWLYSVTVSNLAYGVASSNAVLTVSSDTNPPVLLKAASYDGNTIVLTFNEMMDDTTYNQANYQVDAGAVGVASATLNPDGQTVTLHLMAPITGSFTIVVNNVQDLAGNPITPNSMLVGQVIALEDQDLLFDFGAAAATTEFGPAPNDPDNYWNNVTASVASSDFGELFNLVTIYNTPTTIGLAMITRFNSVNENGTLVSTVFPQRATRDSFYGNTEAFNSLENIFPSFKLNGLNPARKYSLTFYASRTGVGDNRETGYTVTGANSGFTALNAANNINNTATVEGITPTEVGEIAISLAPTENNNNGNHFTYLGVLRISPYVVPLQFLPATIENGQIKLEWTGSGQLLRASSVTGPWTPVVPAPTSPYSEALTPGENRFFRLQQ